MGRGDEKAADQAAVDAMRQALNVLDIDGTVVIGEGERDEAPMLYHRRAGGHRARAPRSTSPSTRSKAPPSPPRAAPTPSPCIAMAAGRRLPQRARHLHGQDRRRRRPAGRAWSTSTRRRPRISSRLAEAKGVEVDDLVVCILDRPRHEELIAKRARGRRPHPLISDGDVGGVIATSRPDTGIDIYMGSGGAPEGVLAAAALRCIGGQFQGRLMFRNDDERARAAQHGRHGPRTASTTSRTWPRAT